MNQSLAFHPAENLVIEVALFWPTGDDKVHMDKKKLTTILQAYPEISAAILFGSQADGTATKESDIDIALLYTVSQLPTPLQLLAFRQELSDQMHQDVDVVLLNDASPIIAMQAAKYGKPLFVRDKKAFDAFEVRLITDYADVKQMRRSFEKNILNRKLHD